MGPRRRWTSASGVSTVQSPGARAASPSRRRPACVAASASARPCSCRCSRSTGCSRTHAGPTARDGVDGVGDGAVGRGALGLAQRRAQHALGGGDRERGERGLERADALGPERVQALGRARRVRLGGFGAGEGVARCRLRRSELVGVVGREALGGVASDSARHVSAAAAAVACWPRRCPAARPASKAAVVEPRAPPPQRGAATVRCRPRHDVGEGGKGVARRVAPRSTRVAGAAPDAQRLRGDRGSEGGGGAHSSAPSAWAPSVISPFSASASAGLDDGPLGVLDLADANRARELHLVRDRARDALRDRAPKIFAFSASSQPRSASASALWSTPGEDGREGARLELGEVLEREQQVLDLVREVRRVRLDGVEDRAARLAAGLREDVGRPLDAARPDDRGGAEMLAQDRVELAEAVLGERPERRQAPHDVAAATRRARPPSTSAAFRAGRCASTTATVCGCSSARNETRRSVATPWMRSEARALGRRLDARQDGAGALGVEARPSAARARRRARPGRAPAAAPRRRSSSSSSARSRPARPGRGAAARPRPRRARPRRRSVRATAGSPSRRQSATTSTAARWAPVRCAASSGSAGGQVGGERACGASESEAGDETGGRSNGRRHRAHTSWSQRADERGGRRRATRGRAP